MTAMSSWLTTWTCSDSLKDPLINSGQQFDVTAAIVNYGNCRDTVELVKKIESQVKKIIVVDNSNDIDSNHALHEKADVITPLKNIGFGAAVNLAANHTESRWLLILNPDVRLRRNCLKHLVAASVDLNTPLCGPRFYWDDACTLQLPPALGHPLWLLSDRHTPNTNLADMPDLSAMAVARHERYWKEQASFSEPVLAGACLLVDNFWFRKNNMPIFDEDFFLYYEDTDLCARLMRKGIMPVCVAQASAVHYWNQSAEPPEGKADLMQASEKIFMEKYYPNGAPPLPRAEHEQEFTEIGTFTSPLALILPTNTCHLDIGVQKDFIVFARASIEQHSFTFSQAMWKRLRQGNYYFRASDKDGKAIQYWSWTKGSE